MDLVNKQKLKKINNNIVIKIVSGRLLFGKFNVLINILSVLISWYFNKSIGWAIFHYIFGFWNLLYSVLSRRFADGGFIEIMNFYF